MAQKERHELLVTRFITPPQVLEFVDEHGNEVLNLGSFTLLPQHVVRLIMARDELKADEFTKFQVSLARVHQFPSELKTSSKSSRLAEDEFTKFQVERQVQEVTSQFQAKRKNTQKNASYPWKKSLL